jgi:lipopolysaccharide transport system ATP-binding protein
VPGEVAVEATGLGKAFLLARRPASGALVDKATRMLSRRRRDADTLERWAWAVRDVDLRVERGTIHGIIGRNGSGKTTLLKMLARVTAPTEGSALVHGRVAALLQVGAGFHPQLTGRDNVVLSGAILGMSRLEVEERFDEIVSFSEIGRYLDQPVKNYSSGMFARLAFSVAAFMPAEIMLIDEALSVGDTEFQAKAQAHMRETLKDGRTVVYVGHDLHNVRRICSSVMVLDKGHVAFQGTADEAVDWYEERIVTLPPEPERGRRRAAATL